MVARPKLKGIDGRAPPGVELTLVFIICISVLAHFGIHVNNFGVPMEMNSKMILKCLRR